MCVCVFLQYWWRKLACYTQHQRGGSGPYVPNNEPYRKVHIQGVVVQNQITIMSLQIITHEYTLTFNHKKKFDFERNLKSFIPQTFLTPEHFNVYDYKIENIRSSLSKFYTN